MWSKVGTLLTWWAAKANGGPGILHTIFFHRFFPSIRPKTRDVLDLTLPVVEDVELETLIDQRTTALVRQLGASSDMGVRSTGVRGQIAVQFFEKRRRKAWFTKGEEEVCWEQWTLDVTLATPRTESGKLLTHVLTDRFMILRLL
jgi:autophagy-related protein 101